jgi:thiol-disulfide isomerase/thioredoxin
MKGVVVGVVLLILAAAVSAAKLPRPSPDFALSPPGGDTLLLSSLKGKVVVMEFLFIRSEHCLRVAQMLNSLQRELGPRGFQSVGIVFDPPNGASAGGQGITAMVSYFKLSYPVAYASKDRVDSYLDRAPTEVLNIPQIVVIDRKGTIRAVSGGSGGDPKLENESTLRVLIDGLLAESK